MNNLPKLSMELIALAYLQLVQRHATAAWRTGHSTQLLATLAQVCADCEIDDPLTDPLTDRLASAHAALHDRYMVKVVLAASALWEHDAGFALLTALIPNRLAGLDAEQRGGRSAA